MNTVCRIVLSPLVGFGLPSQAAKLPLWLVLVMVSDAPAVVQPAKVPVSKPPLVTTGPVPTALTVSDTVVTCVADAPVPVTVTENVPVGVVDAVLSVSVEPAPLLTEAGLKLAVAPVGSPLALRLMLW